MRTYSIIPFRIVTNYIEWTEHPKALASKRVTGSLQPYCNPVGTARQFYRFLPEATVNQPDTQLRRVAQQEEAAFLLETPQYGQNYGRGWIGFNHASSWMSKGIAFVTKEHRDRGSGIPISHVFIVTGEDECVEAAFRKGVVVSSLSEAYFDRQDRYVIFRKPLGLNDDIADRIVATVRTQIGADFNDAALVTSALTENFVGSLINRWFDGQLKEFLAKLAEDEGRWICSELAAYC